MLDITQSLLEKIADTENQIRADDYINDTYLYNKLIGTLKVLESRIKTQNHLLFDAPNITTPIQTNLNNLFSYTKSFYDSQNKIYIKNINDTLNAIIQTIAMIPVTLKGETATSLNKVLQDFENSSTTIIEELKTEKESLKTQITELKSQITALEKRIEIKNTELDSISSNQQKQFSEAQEKRLNVFSDKLKEFEQTFNEQVAEQSNNYSETFDQLKSTAESKIQSMGEIQNKIEKIYSIVGQESIVGSQKMYADRAKKFANWLFWLSIVLMIAFACTVIWPVLKVVCPDFIVYDNTKSLSDVNWEILLYRLPTSALLLLPAIYMANESKKQRDKESKYRELEIKMAAIEPYFNNICDKGKNDIPEKDTVKLELAKLLLTPKNEQSNDNIIISKDILDLVKEIVKVMTSIKK